jgi:cell division transport system permease protein
MRALAYAVRQAAAGLRRGRGSTVLAMLAIGVAMVAFGSLLLVSWNVERWTERWSAAAEFSVYLEDDATSEQRGAIEEVIDASGLAGGREYLSKDAALSRFRREFAELASLTGTDDNPFPASVEVRVAAAAAPGEVEGLVRALATMPGVADVQYDRQWLSRVESGLTAVRTGGFALAGLLALAAALTVAAVVRLGLQSRRVELEIMDLVGSPLSFLRGPFIVEGILQGGLGSMLALGVLGSGFALVLAWWGDSLQALLDGATLRFLPVRFCVWLVLGGMAVGGTGGLAASRHAGSR